MIWRNRMIYSGTQLILSFLWNEYLVWQELCFAVGATPFEDELNLAAIKNQILSNLRIVKGDKIDSHTITTAYDKNTKSWRAVIWDDSNDVFLATTAFTETLVADMYKLLRMTSVIVNSRMDSWEAKHKKGTFHILGGIMYT